MDMFYALAEPNRRRIVEMLANRGQLSASDICDKFDVSAPAISQHLKILREANLVQVEKRAQQRIYQINPQAMLQLQGWAKQMMQLWNQRFDAFDDVLKVEKEKLLKQQNKKDQKHGKARSRK
jgi:DNA-binding transcriptional ArsR family regulator